MEEMNPEEIKTALEEYVDGIIARFMAMKGDDSDIYVPSHGHLLSDGRYVVGFYNMNNDRTVEVYVNENDVLMPYFPQKEE